MNRGYGAQPFEIKIYLKLVTLNVVALGNEAKVGDLVKPKKLNCIYFKTNNKQIMNNEEKGQICSKGHQRKERNSDWINKLGLKKGKDRKDLISKQKKK